jgi:putative flippase GtrA
MNRLIREAFGYLGASACALGADVVILWSLVHFVSCGYLTAATVSFLAGAGVAYLFSVKFVFKERRLQDQRTEFAGFVAIGILGVGINAGIMTIAIRYIGLHYLLAKGISAGFTFAFNFVARRQILFARRSTARDSAPYALPRSQP